MRVDFYLIESTEQGSRDELVCRLLEKAYMKGHQIIVYCNDRNHAETLDELLWQFRPDSFIPHNLQGEGPDPPPPVQIGCQQAPRGFYDILINLADEIPEFHRGFRRLIEIVGLDEKEKHQSRQHYKQYRQWGYELNTHSLKQPESEH